MAYKQRDMNGKICVVTGANRGIGRATAQELADLGATVILVCRNRQTDIIEILKIDHQLMDP